MDIDRLQAWNCDLRLQHQHADGSWGTLEPGRAAMTPAERRSGARLGRTVVIYACTTCDELVRVAHGERRPRPRGRLTPGREPTAAEAADHVVEDRQPEPQRVERDALVDAVEALEEPLVRVEAERGEAVGRHAQGDGRLGVGRERAP